jgi:RNA polymerase sigma-70 factor, ECF subfamily
MMDAQARFETLYREQAGSVRRYVRRRWDAASTDDVVADVFLVAWRRLADVPEDPLPWLLGVARRVLANRYRGAARDSALEQRIRSERWRTQPSITEAGQADSEAVWRALNELPDRDREVLLLVAWEGLSSARAARVVGVSANTFAVRLYRARRRLARALSSDSSQPERRAGSATSEVLR